VADTLAVFLANWAGSTWSMLVDSAFLFLIGLGLAGLLWLVLNETTIRNFVRGGPLISVLKAALIGVPLPLCSCSVLPVVTQLRRAGVGKGGAVSFLVATPESGVDSILMTYALTDPLLTVARPIAAFITALVAGATEAYASHEKIESPPAAADVCADDCRSCEAPRAKGSLLSRILSGLRYAVTDLLKDLAPYLAVGYALAGLVGVLLGGSFLNIPASVAGGWTGYAWAIIIGVPLYVCATSSTPLAAVLLGSGFSPGAILVFLLVGPATNVASIAVVRRIIGTWSTVRYLAIIIVIAILCGLAVDGLYRALGIVPSYHATSAAEKHAGWIQILSAVLLTVGIVYYTGLRLLRRAK
jgi:uncharacterized membrane protein YraQ (UPF0718 family)